MAGSSSRKYSASFSYNLLGIKVQLVTWAILIKKE